MKAITPTMIPKITRITPPIINLICQRQKRERTETGMSEKERGEDKRMKDLHIFPPHSFLQVLSTSFKDTSLLLKFLYNEDQLPP
jgi:hypothetical protein